MGIQCKLFCYRFELLDHKSFEGRGAYCGICLKYIDLIEVVKGKCPCCHGKVRLKPRFKHGNKRKQERIRHEVDLAALNT